MKLSVILATASVFAVLSTPLVSQACGGGVGWAVAQDSPPKMPLDQVISMAYKAHGLEVKRSEMQSRCGTDDDFEVVDAQSKQRLGNIPVPREDVSSNDGRTLTARLEQLLQTPREQLIALENARFVFRHDTDGLSEDLGISAYVPNALPIEERTSKDGLKSTVYVTLDAYCTANYEESPSQINQNFQVKTLEYIPGRTDYNLDTIYQAGDLRKAVLADKKTMAEIKKRVASNARYCRNDNYGNRQGWRETDIRLELSPEKLKWTAVQRIKALKSDVKSAFMLNSNRIAVQFENGTRSFAGTIAEMKAVQALVEAKGIKVDKTSRLDWKGKIDLDSAQRYNRAIPASLAD